MQALQLLLERARQRGEEEVALRWATRLLAAEPWQEEAQRQLMRLLARRGQRQAALQQYAVCCRVLREKLGRTPHAATQALYEQLCTVTGVRHDPCMRDVFAAVVAHANGEPARPWWEFTPARKARDAAHPKSGVPAKT